MDETSRHMTEYPDRSDRPSFYKFLSQPEILNWRNGRQGVVFTNGVFDVIHRGHISLFETARSEGENLVVALNDDASARRLDKGADRPINSLEDRAAVVAALASVDRVTFFSEDTPEELIRLLAPDVLVKGGDYHGRWIPGQDIMKELGGKVVTIDYLDGYSTTKIVRRIRGSN